MIYTYDDSILGEMSFFPYTAKFNWKMERLREREREIEVTCLLVVVVGFGVVESDIELVVASREVVDAGIEFNLNEDV